MLSNEKLVEKLRRGGNNSHGEPRRDVFISFYVQGVHEIDIVKQKFHVHFIMYAAWDEEVGNINLDGTNFITKFNDDEVKQDDETLENTVPKEHFDWSDMGQQEWYVDQWRLVVNMYD